MIDIQKVIAVLFLCCIAACNSFQHAVSRPLTRKMTTCTQMQNNNEVNNGMSRRDMIQLATNGIGLALVAGFPCVSLAVVPSQTGKSGLYCFIWGIHVFKVSAFGYFIVLTYIIITSLTSNIAKRTISRS